MIAPARTLEARELEDAVSSTGDSKLGSQVPLRPVERWMVHGLTAWLVLTALALCILAARS
jgi:hypothetical protein